MNKNTLYILYVIIGCLLVSCKTKTINKIDYVKNVDKVRSEQVSKPQNSTIQKYDQLVILISAEQLDVVKPFNQNYASSQIVPLSAPYGNMLDRGLINFAGLICILDSVGDTNCPVSETLNITGKMFFVFKNEVGGKVSKYLMSPTTNIRIANMQVAILDKVKAEYSHIVVDIPPPIIFTDEFLIVNVADCILYATISRHMKKSLTGLANKYVESTKIKNDGFVLNDADQSNFEYGNIYCCLDNIEDISFEKKLKKQVLI